MDPNEREPNEREESLRQLVDDALTRTSADSRSIDALELLDLMRREDGLQEELSAIRRQIHQLVKYRREVDEDA